MTFQSEKLFEQKVQPLCGDNLIKIKNGVKMHLSYNGCDFERVDDQGSSADSFKGNFATPTALNIAYPVGQPGWYTIVNSTDTFWIWSSVSLTWVNSGTTTMSYLGLSDTTDTTYVGKAGQVPTVNNTETGLTLRANVTTDEFVKVGSTGTPDYLNDSEFQQDGTNHITILSIPGDKVAYDNTTSGMTATDTQAAIDELHSDIVAQDTLQEITDNGNTTDNDIEITDTLKGIILVSPDSTRRRITIDNTGNPVFTSL